MSIRDRANRKAALSEYYRRNFQAFCARELKIRPIEGGALVPFVLDEPQKILDEKIERQLQHKGYVRIVTLKGRQQGWSTYAEARLFHRAIFYPQTSGLLIACDDPSTRKIFDIARTYQENLSDTIRPQVQYLTKREMVFKNPNKYTRHLDPGLGSELAFQSATNIMAGTGTTRQILHVSEVSKFYEDQFDLLVSSLLPTIHPVPGTMVIFESTAYVGGDHFKELCERARDGKSDYVFCFVPWWLNRRNAIALEPKEKLRPTPEEKILLKLAAKGQPADDVPPHEITAAQLKWYRVRLEEFGDLFEQEYPRDFKSAWVSRDANVFDLRILHDMASDLRDPTRIVEIRPGPKVQTVRKGGKCFADEDYVAIWSEPEAHCVYDIGVDVSLGVEDGDWSVAIVMRRDTHEQVAELHRKCDPIDLAHELYWLGKFYNTAQIGVEMNGPGYNTGGEIGRLAYPYIYRWRHRERDVPTMSHLAGWKMQHDSKKIAVGTTRHLFNHRNMTVRSRMLWDEMSNFVNVGEQTYRAYTGHDDGVIALLIANQIAVDEDFGAPAAPSEKPMDLLISPAFRDDTIPGRNRKDPEIDERIRELRGGP